LHRKVNFEAPTTLEIKAFSSRPSLLLYATLSKCRRAFDYARAAHECHLDAHGARFEGPRLSFGLAAPIPLRPVCAGVVADFTLGASQIVTAAAFVMASLAKPSGQPMNGVSQTQDHSP
jgi:hypothetical protein